MKYRKWTTETNAKKLQIIFASFLNELKTLKSYSKYLESVLIILAFLFLHRRILSTLKQERKCLFSKGRENVFFSAGVKENKAWQSS